MAAASVQSALSKMYKNIYKGRDLSNMSKRKTPLGRKIAVKDELYGASLTYPINWGLGWGIYPGLDAANPAAKATKFENWVIPCDSPSKLYGRVTIDNPSAMRSMRDVGAFMRLKQKEIQATVDNMNMIRFGNNLWSDGAADIAQVLAVTGAAPVTSFTLTNYEDGIKFDGSGRQLIQFAVAANRVSGGARNSVWQVDKVERFTSTGTTKVSITLVSGSTDPAATDYVYINGTYNQTNQFKGIPAWIPLTTPSATPFYGVDRSVEPEMLAGFRGTWEGTIADSASRLVSIMGAYFEGEYSALWLSPYRWYQLQFELQGKNMFVQDTQKSLEWGTTVMNLITPSGAIPVMADPYCPSTAGYLLNHSQMEYLTTGPLIHFADEDLEALRLSDDDGLEYRIRSLALFRMDKPHTCGVFPISQS